MLAGRARKSLQLRLADAADSVLGRRDRLTPPRRLSGFVGDSDFAATGREFVHHLQRLAGLCATDRVLDIGCGIGRIARVLAPELHPPGSYDGFDVAADAIAWCEQHYRDTAAPFRFLHADIHNDIYNRAGSVPAGEYRFPFADRSFDLVIATSVFTHVLAADHYLAEAARVLAPGGRLFSTWLLLTPTRSACDFIHALGSARVADLARPEAAVAYEEVWLRRRLTAHGLRAREPVHWGTWAGGPGLSYQDIVVADAKP